MPPCVEDNAQILTSQNNYYHVCLFIHMLSVQVSCSVHRQSGSRASRHIHRSWPLVRYLTQIHDNIQVAA